MGGLGVLAALALAAAPPTADFSVSPAVPVVGQTATFTASATDPEGGPLGMAWDLDGDGSADDGAGPVVRTRYSSPGVRRARLDVTDAEGITASTTRNVAVNAPPTASITWTPAAPTVDDLVALRANEADADGTVTGVGWDTDADGLFDDAPSLQAPRPGAYPVAVLVTDDDGGQTLSRASVEVVNRPPFAGFGFVPLLPRRGRRVTFTSTAADHGALAYACDLDGDGGFDDATGARAVRRMRGTGPRTVGLLVTDEQGASATAFATLTVTTRSAPAISPSPVVRLAGRVTRRGARVRRLTVQAPRTALVEVTCRGGGCPFAVRRVVPRRARTPVRFTSFEGRRLAPGALVIVRVSAENRLGKYTRFRVRAGRAPARIDRCLEPGDRAPARCPAS